MLEILHIFLGAAGVLLLIWIALGWLVLGQDRGGLCVRCCRAGTGVEALRFAETCLWLRETGLIHMRVLLVLKDMPEEEQKEIIRFGENKEWLLICFPEELAEVLEREAKEHGRAGTITGNCNRDHISKS